MGADTEPGREERIAELEAENARLRLALEAAGPAPGSGGIRFDEIANSVDQMIWSTRPDGFHDFYNSRWYEFTGVPRGSTDGEAWNGMFHPDDQARAQALWHRCLANGEPYQIEYRLRHRTGRYRWVLGRAQPVRDFGGRIIRWYGTCTDIHDLKIAQDKLRETQARSRDVLQGMREGFVLLSPELRLLDINAEGERIDGRNRAELIGRHLLEIWPESVHLPTLPAYRQALAEQQPRSIEYRHVSDQHDVWLEVRIYPVDAGLAVFYRDIGERKHIQAEVEEARLRGETLAAEQSAILGQLAEAVIVTDGDGRISFVNEAAERLHGAKLLGVGPDDYSDTYHLLTEAGDPHPPGELPLARAVTHGETVVDARWRIRRPDGSEVLAIGSARPIRLSCGTRNGAVLTARDDTERYAAEQGLRQSEERLRLVVNSASDYAIFTIDPDRRITSWSAGAGRIFGLSADGAIGESADIIFTPEDRAAGAPIEEVETARRAGCADDERWHLRADGSRVFMSGSVHPLPPNANGQEQGFIKIARDETDRRAAETAVRESEEQLRLVLDAAPGGFYSVDREGNTTLVSQGFLDMMGFADESEVIGTKLHPVIHHTHSDGSPYAVADCPIYRCASAGEPAYVADELFFRRDGTPVPVEYRVSPMMRGGEQVGAVCTIADLTQRKAAEAAVRESEARFRNLADHAPVMMWVTDPGGFCTYLNRAWYEFTGQSEAEAEGFGWLDATHPDDKQLAEDAFVDANAAHRPFRVEYRLRRADGSYRWAIDAAAPRFGADGEYLGYVGSVIDIDERREIEDALRTSEDRLRLAAEATAIGIWDFDLVANVLRWDERCKRLFGLPEDAEIDFGTFLAGLHPDDHEHTIAAMNQALALDGSDNFNTEYRTIGLSDGIERFVAANGRAVFEGEGDRRRPVRFVGTVIDISQPKSAEAALAASEAALRQEGQVLETLNRTGAALAAELDLDKLVQMVTDAGVELTGAKFGAFFYNVVVREGEAMMLYNLSGAERSDFEAFGMPRHTAVFKPTFEGEATIRSDDILVDPRYGHNLPHHGMPHGHLPVRSYLAVPVTSRSGEVIGGILFGHPEPGRFSERHERLVVGIAAQAAVSIDNARLFQAAQRELAERVRAEERLRELNETLEQRVAAEVAQRSEAEEALRQMQKMETLGQLTGGVAHDFNNLLQIVTGNLEILQRNLPEDMVRLRRSAENAMRGAERAAVLTQRLLAFARRQPLEPKPISLNRLVGGMSELLHRTLGETYQLETVLASGLWNVEADPNQLENAIINLAVNARDAMPGGGKLTIETSNTALDHGYSAQNTGVAPGQYVVICVSDTGTGMDTDTLDRVFEPFFTTKDVGRGTGLGLSMVYGFVKQSGGHVKIYSEAGQGTTVKLYLPRRIGAVADEEPAIEPLVPEGSRDETILVCEDDDDVRTYSVEVLRELGYRVLEAHDGPSALSLLERQGGEVDLLFTDVVLPGGMMGDRLAAQARVLRPELKVLFTTGYARNAIVHHGRLDPGVELITKPFTYADLAARIRDLLDQTG